MKLNKLLKRIFSVRSKDSWKNKYKVGKSLTNLSKRFGFRLSTGFSERVIFKELFLSGLTLIDLERMDDWQPTLSHIAARQEMRKLLASLNLTSG